MIIDWYRKLDIPNLRIRFPLIVISVISISLIIDSALFYSNSLDELEREKTKFLSDVVQQLNVKISQSSSFAVAHALMIANMPAVKDLFRKKDRKALEIELMPLFQKQKKLYDVNVIQFHTAPATSFLRMHKPQSYGDDLSSFRQTVVITNKTKHAQRGVELGRAGTNIRGVAPVEDSQGHIGSVEFGINFKSIANRIKDQHSVDVGVFANKNLYETVATLEKGNTLGRIENIGDFSYLDSTDKNKILSFCTGEILRNNSDINFVAMKDYAHLAVSPMRDYSGEVIGTVVVMKSFEGLHNKFHKVILREIVWTIIEIIMVFVVITVVFNSLLILPLRRLTQYCNEAVRTDDRNKLQHFDAYVGEIKILSRAVSKLLKTRHSSRESPQENNDKTD